MYETQIRVVATKRSGHHAIMDWVAAQFQNNTVSFFNDIKAGSNCDKDTADQLPHLEPKVGGDIAMYSYEDVTPEQLFNGNFKLKLPNSPRKITLIVLRDPLNTFASRWKLERKAHWLRPRIGHPPEQQDYIDIWMRLYKDFSRESYFLELNGHKVIPINYNKWSTCENYRVQISKQLPGSTFTDKTICTVPRYGWGSSFDALELEGDARSMDVHNRYKEMMDIPLFNKIIDTNPQLVDIAREHFDIQYETN